MITNQIPVIKTDTKLKISEQQKVNSPFNKIATHSVGFYWALICVWGTELDDGNTAVTQSEPLLFIVSRLVDFLGSKSN